MAFFNSHPPSSDSSWQLSEAATAALAREPEISVAVAEARSQPPFPPGYTPTVIELLHDDVLFLRSEGGEVTHLVDCPDDYVPPFTEIRFDGEMALFMIGAEILVDRATEIASVDALLERLNSNVEEPIDAG